MPFTPWTALGDYLELLDFVAEELLDHVDPVQYSLRLLVPPGSLLAGSAAMRPYLGDLVPEDFAYRWRHPDPRMDELQAAVARTGRRPPSGARIRPSPSTACAPWPPAAGGLAAAAPRRRPRSPPAAASDRAVVLLSGAHAGPVGPGRKIGYSSVLSRRNEVRR